MPQTTILLGFLDPLLLGGEHQRACRNHHLRYWDLLVPWGEWAVLRGGQLAFRGIFGNWPLLDVLHHSPVSLAFSRVHMVFPFS